MSPRFYSLICVMICNLVKIHTSIQIEDLEVNSRRTSWSRAFDECERFAGSELFQHCQPESCNASAAIDRIKNPLQGNHRKEYWINGYVKRSPVVVYEGCFSDVFSEIEDLNVVNTSYTDNYNSVYVCSKFCRHLKDDDFIFLKGVSCYCVPYSDYVRNNIDKKRVEASHCNTKCNDSSGFEWCGGQPSHFSVYKILSYTVIHENIGKTCGRKERDLVYDSCSLEANYMCQIKKSISDIFKYPCGEGQTTFKEAQMDCFNRNGTIHVPTPNEFKKCNFTYDTYWTAYFASEEIVWNNKNVSYENLCLKLIVKNGEYEIEARNCTEKSNPLCTIPYSSSSTDKLPKETVFTTPVENFDQTDNPTFHSNAVPVIGGAVGGGIAFVILFGFLIFFCKRKQNKNSKMPSVASNSDRQSENYSSCTPDATSQPQESHRLINVTPEGVYNQLGDKLPVKPTDQISSLYDVTGKVENEYDVSNTAMKPRENETGLYDDSRIVEDVYNTTNSENLTDRPVSDTYHVPNT